MTGYLSVAIERKRIDRKNPEKYALSFHLKIACLSLFSYGLSNAYIYLHSESEKVVEGNTNVKQMNKQKKHAKTGESFIHIGKFPISQSAKPAKPSIWVVHTISFSWNSVVCSSALAGSLSMTHTYLYLSRNFRFVLMLIFPLSRSLRLFLCKCCCNCCYFVLFCVHLFVMIVWQTKI